MPRQRRAGPRSRFIPFIPFSSVRWSVKIPRGNRRWEGLFSSLNPQDWCHGNWVLGNHDNHRLMQRLRNNTRLATTAPRAAWRAHVWLGASDSPLFVNFCAVPWDADLKAATLHPSPDESTPNRTKDWKAPATAHGLLSEPYRRSIG